MNRYTAAVAILVIGIIVALIGFVFDQVHDGLGIVGVLIAGAGVVLGFAKN